MMSFKKGWLLPGVLVFPLLVHLSLGLRLSREVHGDEIWTLSMVLSKAWQQIPITVLTEDNHPPFYYMVAKTFMELTRADIPGLRWLSFLFSFLTICSLAWLYRDHRPSEKIFALGLLGTNPLLTYYSATVRPYSLIVMLAAVMTISAFQLKRPQSEKVFLAKREQASGLRDPSATGRRRFFLSCFYYGSALLLGLTHYFGTLYVWVAIFGDLVTRRIERRPWKGFLILFLTGLWPLAQILFGSLEQQSQSNAWIRVVFLLSTINNFFAANFPLIMISKSIPQYSFGALLALIVLLILLRPIVKKYWQQVSTGSWQINTLLAPDEVFWSLVCAAVLAVGCLADTLIPFTTPYYFLVCLPAVSLLLGKLFSASGRDRFSSGLSYISLLAIAALQIVLSYQRLALP